MDEAEVLGYIIETYRGTNPLQAAGDTYFLYDPARDLPPERQHPYATLITGDRHDRVSRLDRVGVYRLNIGVTRQTYVLVPTATTFETVVAPLLDEAYEFAVRKHTNQAARREG